MLTGHSLHDAIGDITLEAGLLPRGVTADKVEEVDEVDKGVEVDKVEVPLRGVFNITEEVVATTLLLLLLSTLFVVIITFNRTTITCLI